MRLPWPLGGRKPPPPAPSLIAAAAPLLARLDEMAGKIDVLFRKAEADERARVAEAERRRPGDDPAAESKPTRADAEAADRERDRVAGELRAVRARAEAAERERDSMAAELDDSREALGRERARSDGLARALEDAGRKAEAAERDAEQILHDAELKKQSGVDSFRARLGDTLRRHLVDLPDALPTGTPPGEQILLNRLAAIRRVLRENEIKLD